MSKWLVNAGYLSEGEPLVDYQEKSESVFIVRVRCWASWTYSRTAQDTEGVKPKTEACHEESGTI